MSLVLDKAEYHCTGAILSNTTCTDCNQRKFCEEFKIYKGIKNTLLKENKEWTKN